MGCYIEPSENFVYCIYNLIIYSLNVFELKVVVF